MSRIKRVSTVLVQARAKIADPKHWCQRMYARDKRNRRVEATSPEATQWCAIGAVQAVAPSDLFYAAANLLQESVGSTPVATVNDYRKNPEKAHATILDAFATAIREARRAERAS